MTDRYAWQDLGESTLVRYEVSTGRVVATVEGTKPGLALFRRETEVPGNGYQPMRFAGPECIAMAKAYAEGFWS